MEEEKKEIIVRNEKTNERIARILATIAAGIIIVVLLFLCIEAIIYTAYFNDQDIISYNESLTYKNDNILLNLVGIIIACGIIKIFTKITKKIKPRYLLIVGIIVSALLGLWWVNLSRAILRADQRVVFNFAKNFSEKNYEDLNGQGYLYEHPLQLGCILGIELIIKIVGSTEWISFQRINIIFMSICMFLLYQISRKIYKSEENQHSLVLLMVMLLIIPLYNVVVYGNIYGFTFSLLAIFLLLKYYENRKKRYIFLIPLAMGIAIMLKSNYEIIAIAIIISLVLDVIRKISLKTIVTIVLILVVLFGTYPLIYKIVEARTGYEVNDGIPMIAYIAMSIQERVSRNSGWYHDYRNVETMYYGNKCDAKKTAEESKEIILDRLEEFKNNPKMAEYFYLDKIKSTWLEPAYQTLWWAEPLEEFYMQPDEYKEYITNNKIFLSTVHGRIFEVLIPYLDIMEIIIFGLSSISLIYSIKNKEINNENIILVLCFLGGFLFHILWETKCIYVIPFYLMLLPSAADGINRIKIKKFSFKKK